MALKVLNSSAYKGDHMLRRSIRICLLEMPQTNGALLRIFRCFVTLFVIFLPISIAAEKTSLADTSGRPNVVVFFMDDLGYGDLRTYGAIDVRTPNLDRLAREGVRLTDCYAAAPLCTPT